MNQTPTWSLSRSTIERGLIGYPGMRHLLNEATEICDMSGNYSQLSAYFARVALSVAKIRTYVSVDDNFQDEFDASLQHILNVSVSAQHYCLVKSSLSKETLCAWDVMLCVSSLY